MQSHPDTVLRLGGWLFKKRTWLPLPFATALLIIPARPASVPVSLLGLVIVAAGELVRLWAVRHIGVISRTRSDRLGPLVSTGPFARVRNPLYIGNLLLWIGFTVGAGLMWLVPIVVVLLGAEYHAIVRWEEGLLEARVGEAYGAYAARVPRWNPFSRQSPVGTRQSAVASRQSPVASQSAEVFSWRETLFSERGTLIAIAVGYVLLWLKSTVNS